VAVTARSGKTWEARVAAIVWTGSGVAICSTARRNDDGRRNDVGIGRRTGCPCGSREGYPRDSDCAQCRFDNE
jgi:hypothetical protein